MKSFDVSWLCCWLFIHILLAPYYVYLVIKYTPIMLIVSKLFLKFSKSFNASYYVYLAIK